MLNVHITEYLKENLKYKNRMAHCPLLALDGWFGVLFFF